MISIYLNIEAGVDQGWHKYIGAEGIAIALTWFGESGSISDLAERFGYTKEAIANKITHLTHTGSLMDCFKASKIE